jgi:hypothetical protein
VTQIEDLVRQALAETPTASPTTDPLAALDRRVRRARRWIAAGACGVTAAVVAAVVVPLAVLGDNSSPQNVKVITPPTPKSLPAGTTSLWPSGAVSSATDSSGQRWVLYKEGEHNYLQPIGNTGVDKLTSVQGPADYLVAGEGVLWVVGTASGEPGDTRSRITAINTDTGNSATIEQTQLSGAAASGHSLYVIESDASGAYVARIDFDSTGMGDTGEVVMPGAQEIVATAQGHLWVHADGRLVELTPTQRGFITGESVDWGSGAVLAPTLPRSAGDGVWADDGRLIALTPSALAGCVSCAEGDRVFVSGHPSAVVETHDGLFVAIPGSGIDFYAADVLASGNTPVTASLRGVETVSMVAGPDTGVDVTDSQGRLFHWDPAGARAR